MLRCLLKATAMRPDTIYFLLLYGVNVPDQVGTLSQVGTKKISKGGWTILEPFEPHRNHYLVFVLEVIKRGFSPAVGNDL